MGQPAPMMLENDNLFAIDYGFNRNYMGHMQYSCGTEYVIDENSMTVQQVWQFEWKEGKSCLKFIGYSL